MWKGNTKTHWVNLARNVANFSRGGGHKTSVQEELLKHYQEVEFTTITKGRNIENSQEGGFISHHYRQKYLKILKRWNL